MLMGALDQKTLGGLILGRDDKRPVRSFRLLYMWKTSAQFKPTIMNAKKLRKTYFIKHNVGIMYDNVCSTLKIGLQMNSCYICSGI